MAVPWFLGFSQYPSSSFTQHYFNTARNLQWGILSSDFRKHKYPISKKYHLSYATFLWYLKGLHKLNKACSLVFRLSWLLTDKSSVSRDSLILQTIETSECSYNKQFIKLKYYSYTEYTVAFPWTASFPLNNPATEWEMAIEVQELEITWEEQQALCLDGLAI